MRKSASDLEISSWQGKEQLAVVAVNGSTFGEIENAESCRFCLISESLSSQFLKLTRSKDLALPDTV